MLWSLAQGEERGGGSTLLTACKMPVGGIRLRPWVWGVDRSFTISPIGVCRLVDQWTLTRWTTWMTGVIGQPPCLPLRLSSLCTQTLKNAHIISTVNYIIIGSFGSPPLFYCRDLCTVIHIWPCNGGGLHIIIGTG